VDSIRWFVDGRLLLINCGLFGIETSSGLWMVNHCQLLFVGCKMWNVEVGNVISHS